MPDWIGGVERKPDPPAVSFQPLPRNEMTSAPVKGAAPTAQMAGPTTTEQCRYHQPIGDFVERRAACFLPVAAILRGIPRKRVEAKCVLDSYATTQQNVDRLLRALSFR